MQKFKSVGLVGLGLILGVMGFWVVSNNKSNETYEDTPVLENKELLSMMLETEAGTGKYQETKASEWPTDEYVFDENRSGCENGSTLSWDDKTKNVIMDGIGADKCYVYFNKKIKLYEYVKMLYTGKQGENNLYYHNGTIKSDDGNVLDASDNSYRYSGGDFQLTEKATISGLTKLNSSSNTTTDGVINFYCDGTRQYVGYSCSSSYTSYYTLQYDATFTQYSTYNAARKKAIYDGYVKNHINNFVCFGYDSTDGTCPSDNLYRIIGVFDNEVKLIKYDYAKASLLGTDGAYYSKYNSEINYYGGTTKGINTVEEIGSYYWDGNSTGLNWKISYLNTVNLNKNFLYNVGNLWSERISNHIWILGGKSRSDVYNLTLQNLSIDNTNTYETKVGLMYISDYGYASSQVVWAQSIGTYNNYNELNWMHMGLYEWTIMPDSSSSYAALYVTSDGTFSAQCCKVQNRSKLAARPVFYLNSSVKYESGNGSMETPYIIS